jgi:hypothetical protein
MNVISVCCNKCGAPLEVPDKTKFLTCSHCGSKLEVQNSGGAYFTSVLEQIGRRTEKMSDDLETIKHQNDLERIDREWQMKREGLMVRGKDGSESVPSAAGGVIGGGIAVAFGFIWTIAASSMGAPAIFLLFGVFFVGAALYGIISSVHKANEYDSLKQQYESERSEVMSKIKQ